MVNRLHYGLNTPSSPIVKTSTAIDGAARWNGPGGFQIYSRRYTITKSVNVPDNMSNCLVFTLRVKVVVFY